MSGRGYFPSKLGFQVAPTIDFPLDVKNPPFTWVHQLDRAERAIDRFRRFANEKATAENTFELVDEFFEAAQTVWHCKDAVRKALDDGEANPQLKAFLEGFDQRVLRAIANASKHSGLDWNDPVGEGRIQLVLDGRHPPPNEWLSDVYRRLRLLLPGKEPEHPTDFLVRVMNAWNKFALDHLFEGTIAKKAARPEPAASAAAPP